MADTTLKITTILGAQESSGDRGPFLLSSVQGVEGVSLPFYFDMVLYRALEAEDVDVSTLINTPAKFGILTKDESTEVKYYATRGGVFKSFEKVGTTKLPMTAQTDFVVYRARLVPAFAMLEYEQVFRVFENMTVIEIIKEAIGSFANVNASNYLLLWLDDDDFPAIDYCVQFNETTLAFVSRLLGQFGLYYYFWHPTEGESRMGEQMVIGRGLGTFHPCRNPEFEAGPRNFSRAYQPAHRKTQVGDYNILQPSKPATAAVTLVGSYDASPADSMFMRMERHLFPGIMPRNHRDGDAAAAKANATDDQRDEEARVFTAQGESENRSFYAGMRFKVTNKGKDAKQKETVPDDKFGPPLEAEYVLTRLSIIALDKGLGHHWWQDIINVLNPLHWLKRESPSQQMTVKVLSAVTQSSLYESISKEAEDRKLGKKIKQITSAAKDVASVVGPVFSFFSDSISEVIDRHDDQYSNSFTAVPFVPGYLTRFPLPAYQPARAEGPQLAVVVGPKGAKDNPADHLVDALGRVRIRFPWHTDLPEGGEQDPWKTDRRTAWVRVAEGWAGAGMGTQFLPRIGDEVIVSYLDGDPARPVITGRLHNAANGSPTHPFPPGRTAAKTVGAKAVHTPQPGAASLRSGIRTRSTPKPQGAKDRFHLLRFDDAWHDEQLLIRSQGRTDVTSFGPWHDTSHGNRSIRVGGKDPDTGKGGGALIVTTGDEYDLHVGADRYEGVDKKHQLSVKSDTLFDLQGNHDTVVGGTMTLNATKVVVEAALKITLKVGGSFVVIDPAGVFIKGALVQINSGGSPDSTSNKEVTDPLDAGAADPGDPPDWLAQHPPGAAGPRRTHTATAQHGLLVTRNGNTLQIGNIAVAGTPEYQDKVVSQIALMNQTPTGKAMLDDYQTTGRHTTISNNPGPMEDTGELPTNFPASRDGTGSDSTIAYNPDHFPDPSAPHMPGDVALLHEMTHAQHDAHGTATDHIPHGDNFDTEEEFRTIQQENAYRDERGVPRRTDHRSL